MKPTIAGPLILRTEIEQWPMVAPLRIAGYLFEVVDVLLVSLEKDGHIGRGEAAGIYYLNDKPCFQIQQIESLRSTIEAGITRLSLLKIFPPGGARNAIDCALWDLEAKLSGRFAWQMAELSPPRPLLTTFTCGADEPAKMAATARCYSSAKAIKVKLTGESVDAERVRAVREARGDVWLGVDANQGFTRSSLEQILPTLLDTRVQLIEQPFPRGQDELLEGFHSPIPIAADESVQTRSDLPKLVGRFNVVNIKLDKCGGLTEGLAMARTSRALGFDTMVGNMLGTSLAMAPAFLVGQLCTVVDLDGPILLKADRSVAAQYANGFITCPDALWGNSAEPIRE